LILIVQLKSKKTMQQATLGGGCFWCVEVIYQMMQGVTLVESGYAGGKSDNPTYREICTGQSGHAEVIQITFDPEVVSYQTILEVFFTIHDPTTLNRQGNDSGTQYRSVIYYHNVEQEQIARATTLAAQSLYDDPIVTEVSMLKRFFKAEKYHQNYYQDNTDQPYCQYVITPKVVKFRQRFAGLMRT
jgi:peptide-methionine (S)-S-oxide reductase